MISAFELRQQLLSSVEFIIVAQLYLILSVAACTVVLLSWRRFYNRRLETYQTTYLDTIVQEITELNPDGKSVTTLEKPSPHQFIKSEALRRLLLSQIEAVSGPERRHLISAYIKLGYARADLNNCFSLFWWNRIEGISRISHLDIHGVATILQKLKSDSNILVAESALLAISRLKHEHNNISILRQLPKLTLDKHNILMKVASNWVTVHGIDFVIDYLKSEKRPQVLNAFVAILSDRKDSAVANALVTWFLQHGDLHDTKILLQILRNLKAVGDPLYLPVAKDFLTHEDAIIRSEALDMLISLGADDYRDDIEKMRQDQSLPIQRLLHRYNKKKAA